MRMNENKKEKNNFRIRENKTWIEEEPVFIKAQICKDTLLYHNYSVFFNKRKKKILSK